MKINRKYAIFTLVSVLLIFTTMAIIHYFSIGSIMACLIGLINLKRNNKYITQFITVIFIFSMFCTINFVDHRKTSAISLFMNVIGITVSQ